MSLLDSNVKNTCRENSGVNKAPTKSTALGGPAGQEAPKRTEYENLLLVPSYCSPLLWQKAVFGIPVMRAASLFRSPYIFYLLTVGVKVVYFRVITLRHTPQSVGLLWKRDRPVAEISTRQHKHSQETNIHAPVGFEPTIPASARPQIYALGRAATRIGLIKYICNIY
jgi:hypothetical protein